MREYFDLELKALNDKLIEMGALVEGAIKNTITIITNGEYDKLETSRIIEEKINTMEREIQNYCLNLLLLQSPVAGDLRTVSAALKMITDLERIGDQCSDIAELSGYISRCSISHKLHLKQMSECVIQMLDMAVLSFAESDLETARLVYAKDDEVDALFDKVKKEIISIISKDDTDAELLVDLLMVSKYFERIGDHAENIAEWVEYSITGDFVNAM